MGPAASERREPWANGAEGRSGSRLPCPPTPNSSSGHSGAGTRGSTERRLTRPTSLLYTGSKQVPDERVTTYEPGEACPRKPGHLGMIELALGRVREGIHSLQPQMPLC